MNTKQQDKVRRDWEKYMEWTRAITIEKIGEGAYSRHFRIVSEGFNLYQDQNLSGWRRDV